MRFSYLEIVIPELSVFVNKLFLCFENRFDWDQPTMLSLNSIQSKCCWHLCQSREPIKASWRRPRHTRRQRQSTPLPSAASSTLLFSSSWTESVAAADDRASRLRGWRARSQLHSLLNTAPLHKDGRQCLPRPRAAAGFPEKAQRSVRRVRRGRRRIYPRWALRESRSTVRPRRWSKNLSLYYHSLVSFILECLASNVAQHFCILQSLGLIQ